MTLRVCLLWRRAWGGERGLDEIILFEVELQDGVFDGRKDKADVFGVGGTGEVRVDDLIAVGVEVHKHLEDELSPCLSISLGSWKQSVEYYY